MTPLVYTKPRGTAQIDDVSTWLPPSLDTPWQNVFFEYIKNLVQCSLILITYHALFGFLLTVITE